MEGKFILKFLWLEKSIAVSLDQRIGDKTIPLTEYFFWPQKDAWEDMKLYLETEEWISQENSILLLNQITEIINYWQERENISKSELSDIKTKFPNCIFVGSD
uniref:Small ribosomal subunit protein cS23 n=1 Tax=Euglena archaeoplastidiata TaxID=1188008 RepID=A0A1X9GCI4_9EUGL|nr:putative ribosomal protein 3 [Euglena archaeoplastidiata]AKR17874.1 putative ribosomal protein 3 [Euglena archaeoplastidiata]